MFINKFRVLISLLIINFLLQTPHAARMPTEQIFVDSIGMEFVRIEPGSFMMGFGDKEIPDEIYNATEHGGREIALFRKGDYDEHPAHKVTIKKPFYIGIYEVTNEQYERFDPLHVYLRGKKGFSIDNDEAVVFVNWHEATAFCEWLSKKEGLPYRLPTEAEWEYACRAGTITHYSLGDTLPAEFLKNPDNSWYPNPKSSRGREEVVPLYVGKTNPNPWGLYDVHGNVEEWCYDWYGPYEQDNQINPVGRVDGDFKVTRGGSHATVAYYLRSSNRMGTLPEDKSWFIGFRVVIGEMPKTKPLPKVSPKPFQDNVKQGIPTDINKGPDPEKPYCRGPLNYMKIPEPSYGPLYHQHNHCPAIVECPNGDLLAVWYTTVTERGREVSLAISRLRYGENEWEPASLFLDTPDRNDHAPGLWYDGDKRIYFFVGLSTAATWGPLAVIMRTSDDNGATWSRAQLIIPEHGPRHQVIESIFRTQEGYILLPCDATARGSGGTAIHLSEDNGQTWQDRGGTIAGIHAGLVQLKDGRLLAFGRSDNIDGRMPQSISEDLGKTWEYSASPFHPIEGGQRLVLLRLKEGPLFFASFAREPDDNDEFFPPLVLKDDSGKQTPVKGLFAALSYDEGKSWSRMKLLTDTKKEQTAKTTNGREFTMSPTSAEPQGYLSICQGGNGLIHLISSWNHYTFNLKWLETGPFIHFSE
jgi:sulfatase modifying factor 1